MSTSTLTAEQRQNVVFVAGGDAGLLSGAPAPVFEFKKNDKGATVLHAQKIAVFRTGTFRDSMGFQQTWEEIHLDQMVSYFSMLKSRGLFADVPVRDGHPGWLISGQSGNGKVIGYHTDLRVEKHTSVVDGKEYSFLMADYDILDEDAQKAINSGLWRNRSSEIGPYVTNDEAEFWPVYRGVAYVDIPAVEGLNFSSNQFVIAEKEFRVNASIVQPGVPPAVPPTPPAIPPVQPFAAPAPAPTQHAFSCNGAPVTDYAKVQAHIEGLEKFRKETIETGRKNFVTSLSEDNKIPATQVDSLTAFALTLDDDQWEKWSAAYESAAPNPLFTKQGISSDTGKEGTGTSSHGKKEDPQEVETLIGIVKNHRRAGQSKDAVMKLDSYKKLIALQPDFQL